MTDLPPLPTPSWARDMHGETEVYTADEMRAYALAAVAAYKQDAERYRWLKSRKGLTLRSETDHSVWTRLDGTKFNATHYLAEGGTQHAPSESLDATIDSAMLVAAIRARTTDAST